MITDNKISQLIEISAADPTTYVPVVTGTPPVNRKLNIASLTVDLTNYTAGDGLKETGSLMSIDRPVIQSMINVSVSSSATILSSSLNTTNRNLGVVSSSLGIEKNTRILGDISAVSESKYYTDVKVAAVASGSPKDVYGTLSELTAAFPTGDNYTYVVRTDGYWYYWDATMSLWTPGGAYQSSMDVVQEAGSSTTSVMSQAIVTTITDDIIADVATLNTAVSQKLDGGYAEDGLLFLTIGGIPIDSGIAVGTGGGGGGGSVGSTVRVINLISSDIYAALGEPINVNYSFSSIDSVTLESTGVGTAEYYVDNVKVLTTTIAQGNILQNLQPYITSETSIVKVTVIDSYATSRTLTYTVQVVNISITDASFDYTAIFTDTITYRYTPYGAVSKIIHFVLDDVEIGTTTTSYSNRQLTYIIPKQSHGSHLLEVYATTVVGGVTITSNILSHDLICTDTGYTSPVISCQYSGSTAEQLSTILLPYQVYTPNVTTSPVVLSDGSVSSSLNVGRTSQLWSYRALSSGSASLSITSGETTKTIPIIITPTTIDAEAVTDDLELFLTSNGRSNNEPTKDTWIYGGVSCSMSDFNYVSDGWLLDTDGNTVLRVKGNARVTIPLKLFASDFRSTGKTLEFEFSTTSVSDYDTSLISCYSNSKGIIITPQNATFKSEQTTSTTKFKDDERVRVSFVIEQNYTGGTRMIYTFINGIISGISQYPIDDNFQQSIPVNITIGSSDATIDIYNIRSYNNDLTKYQILDNYIADIADLETKKTVYDRNQIFDSYGDMQYSKVVAKIPCMTIIGTLPTFKGDKKVVSVIYEDFQDPTKSFTAVNVAIDVQGTSSQYYPRKNYKLKFNSGVTYTSTGTTSSKYKLRNTSISEKTYTMKADFAESSGTHNIGMAKYVENSLRTMDIMTPPQSSSNYVRTTMDGFPIVIFHKAVSTDLPSFLGKYNFNNDKADEDTFGFTNEDIVESWEFMNNTSDRCLFKSADFTSSLSGSTDPAWYSDFEPRYPDLDVMYRDTTNLEPVFAWVVSTDTLNATDTPLSSSVVYGTTTYTTDSSAYRSDKFKYEFEDHFNLDNLLSYYLITELYGMVDQRAKNMFITSWGNEAGPLRSHDTGSAEAYKWYFIFYDNDTCLGINNEGVNMFNYNIEYHDIIGTLNVWNGANSVLWKNVETAFSDEISTMYYDFRVARALEYDSTMEILNDEQAAKWSEGIYNEDAQFKYINPLIETGNATYLYQAQGSRDAHRRWWLSNRFNYIDSKYNAGEYLSDFLTMRIYTPAVWSDVAPNADFIFIPYYDQYLRVQYGSYDTIAVRGTHNVPTTITAPVATYNDTETIIYGSSKIKNIGSLAAKYPGTVDATFATKLEELIIGDASASYSNTNLTGISLLNNTLLKKLDVRNCPNLSGSLEVSGCTGIEEIYTAGTGISSVKLPVGGVLNTLQLPNSITNLTILNHPYLSSSGLTLNSVDNLSTVRIEGTPNLSTQNLMVSCSLVSGSMVLDRLRVTNVSWSYADTTVMDKLLNVNGLDEGGFNIDTAYISGIVGISASMDLTEYDTLADTFTDATIVAPNLIDYSVTISGSSTLYSTGSYSVTYPTIDYGAHEIARKTIQWSVTTNPSYVDMTISADNQSVQIKLSDTAHSNPVGGVVLRATSSYDSSKFDTKTLTLTGFITGLTITGSMVLQESGSYQYSTIYEPSYTTQTAVLWEIVSGSSFATIDQTGLVNILDGVITDNATLIIKATSLIDGTVYDTETMTVEHKANRVFDIAVENPGIQTNPYVLLSGSATPIYATGSIVSIKSNNALVGSVSSYASVSQSFSYGASTADTHYDFTLSLAPLRTFNLTVGGLPAENAYITLNNGGGTYYADEFGSVLIYNGNEISGTIYSPNSEDLAFTYGIITTDTVYDISLVGVYSITSASDLVTLRLGVNSGSAFDYKGNTIQSCASGSTFTLSNDIDLSSVCGVGVGNWTPIGTSTNKFKGNFDGGNFTISNLYYSNSNGTYIGLFGRILESNIKNIILNNAYLYADEYIGGIVSNAVSSIDETSLGYGKNISNCHIKNSILKSTGWGSVGGIAYYTTHYNIFNCTTDKNTTIGNTSNCAGIVMNAQNSILYNCINNATITSAQLSAGIARSSYKIHHCINNGKIKAGRNSGGICASNTNYVMYCVNNGIIQSYVTSPFIVYVGGIIGQDNIYSPTSYNLNTNALTNFSTGSKYIGAISAISGSTSYFTYNYYDRQFNTYGALDNVDFVNDGEGKLTTELIGTALRSGSGSTGWTDTNWVFTEGMYPIPRGLEIYESAIAGAQPVFLSGSQRYDAVTSDFTVGIVSGSTWSTVSGSVSINNGTGVATLIASGSDSLIATYGSGSKTVDIFVSGSF